MEQMQWRATPRELDMTRARAELAASTVFMARVFNWMMIGLGVTALVALGMQATGLVYLVAGTPLYLVLALAELGLVFYLAARVSQLAPGTATWLFVAYSALNGVTLSAILLRYSGASIASTFLITAGMFGAMALYGMVTKRELTGVGSFMFMDLIGILIAMIVNFFLKSPSLYYAISFIGVIVFVGLTAYDTQKIKEMGEQGIMDQGEAAIQKTAIMGALSLYLDFINLFIMLLRLFGGSRD